MTSRLASDGGPIFAFPTSDVGAPTSLMTFDRDSLVADRTTAALTLGAEPILPMTSDRNSLVADQTEPAPSSGRGRK